MQEGALVEGDALKDKIRSALEAEKAQIEEEVSQGCYNKVEMGQVEEQVNNGKQCEGGSRRTCK